MVDIQAWIQTILPELSAKGPELLTYTVTIVIYGVLIFHFYRFIATRDVFGFDLKRFERKEGSFFGSLVNKILGITKYGIIFPFFVFIWFAGFSMLLFFMARSLGVAETLRVSVVFVAAIRIASYYNDDLSRDLAKLIPFALLGIALVEPSFFQTNIQDKIDQLPLFITEIATYFSFIVLIEWIMRILLSVKFFVLGVNKKEIVKEHLKEKIEEIVED